MTQEFKPGQTLVWTAAPVEECAISHDATHCDRVSFRRIRESGLAEVMTCRGSENVDLADLVPVVGTG